MITVNEEKRIFHLRTPHASYVIGVNDLGVPEMQYFGAAVGDDDLTYLMRRTGRGGQADMPDAKTRNDDFCQTPLEISSHGLPRSVARRPLRKRRKSNRSPLRGIRT